MKLVLIVLTVLVSPNTLASSDFISNLNLESWINEIPHEVRLLLFLSALSFIPAFMIAMTAFTRIVIVLSLLRQALGLMNTPPNMVIITLSLFLTIFVMKPVFEEAAKQSIYPYLEGDIKLNAALEKGVLPFRDFMISQVEEEALETIIKLSNTQQVNSIDEVPTSILVPSFLLGELKIAFQIAFTIFIPFLLIDLIVASTLMALGMIMVPPISISLPLKIMLFVLVDGWNLVAYNLIGSFHS